MPARPRVARAATVLLPLVLSAGALPAQAPDPATAELCRRVLRTPAAAAEATAALERALPVRPWRRVVLAQLGRDVAPGAQAALVAPPPGDAHGEPLLYWRPGVSGATLLHELAHAVHAALPDPALARLLAHVAAHDRTAGYGRDVVLGATRSVVGGLALALPAKGGAATARRLERAVAALPSDGPGALARRLAALHAALAAPELHEARQLLERGLAGRAPTPLTARWDGALRAFLLVEAHAYDVQAGCADLSAAHWPVGGLLALGAELPR